MVAAPYDSVMRQVKVPLRERSYSIFIGGGLLARLGAECAKLKLGQRCAVITDRNVGPRYARTVIASLKVAGFDPVLITVAPGETSKSLKTVQVCYDELASHRLERKSFIVALGGGVVGDLAGFVAATYLRGVPFVQVPPTELSTCASSVVGTCTNGTPRRYVAATKPARSPTTPPPSATMNDFLSSRCDASSS